MMPRMAPGRPRAPEAIQFFRAIVERFEIKQPTLVETVAIREIETQESACEIVKLLVLQ